MRKPPNDRRTRPYPLWFGCVCVADVFVKVPVFATGGKNTYYYNPHPKKNKKNALETQQDWGVVWRFA